MSGQSADKPPTRERPAFRLTIDRDAEVPIGVQLAWALRSRIGEGRLTAGERLPGLRDLAEASGVNVNTVRAVYQRLEQEGLIESQQGSGTFVAANSRRSSPAGKIAAGAAREAYETGVDPREVAAALYVAGEPSSLDDGAAEQRRALRAQIAALERTLAEMEATYPGLVPAPSGSGGIGPALLSATELEHVRAGLVRRLAALQTEIDAQLGLSAAADRPAPAQESAPAPAKAAAKRSARPRSTTRPAPAGT
ncbi:MAG: GntR family transcriptional regulator [Solirubrobacteraceae bacterium]